MRIRSVAGRDVDAVVAFWTDVFPEYRDPARPHREPRANVLRKLAFGDGLFWVAERDGRIVGTVMAGYDGHRGWIYSLAVHTGVRRAGVGRALLSRAERALARLGCTKINLQVFTRNRAAVAFWKSVGYERDVVVSFGKRLAPARSSLPAQRRRADRVR